MTSEETTKDERGVADADRNLHYAIDGNELKANERVLVEIQGREIALFHVDESIHALANYCVHQGGPVCEGQVSGAMFERDGELVWERENEFVSCPWHGWEFEIDTGKHITHPKYRLPSYDTVVRDGDVYVEL